MPDDLEKNRRFVRVLDVLIVILCLWLLCMTFQPIWAEAKHQPPAKENLK